MGFCGSLLVWKLIITAIAAAITAVMIKGAVILFSHFITAAFLSAFLTVLSFFMVAPILPPVRCPYIAPICYSRNIISLARDTKYAMP